MLKGYIPILRTLRANTNAKSKEGKRWTKERCVSPTCQFQKHLPGLVCMALISCRFSIGMPPWVAWSWKSSHVSLISPRKQWNKGVVERFLFMKFLKSTKPSGMSVYNFGPWVWDFNFREHLSLTIPRSVKHPPPCIICLLVQYSAA